MLETCFTGSFEVEDSSTDAPTTRSVSLDFNRIVEDSRGERGRERKRERERERQGTVPPPSMRESAISDREARVVNSTREVCCDVLRRLWKA
jgi:hypothetical protein